MRKQRNTQATVTIYALVDPRTNEVHYIGQTVQPATRYLQHMIPRGYSRRMTWVRGLLAVNLRPRFVPFDTAPTSKEADELERFWIAQGRRFGWPLTNELEGGEEAWRKATAGNVGKTISAEHRASVAAANSRRVLTEAQRKATSERMKAMPRTAAHRAGIAESNRRRGPRSEETKAKISLGHKGISLSAEHRAKIAAGGVGKKRSAETCALISLRKRERDARNAAMKAQQNQSTAALAAQLET